MFACFALLFVHTILYNVYEGRGPRFSARTGQAQTINLPLPLGHFTTRTVGLQFGPD
jgi:hypothetical protein